MNAFDPGKVSGSPLPLTILAGERSEVLCINNQKLSLGQYQIFFPLNSFIRKF